LRNVWLFAMVAELCEFGIKYNVWLFAMVAELCVFGIKYKDM